MLPLSRKPLLQEICELVADSLGEPNPTEGIFGPVFLASVNPDIAFCERAPAVAGERGSFIYLDTVVLMDGAAAWRPRRLMIECAGLLGYSMLRSTCADCTAVAGRRVLKLFTTPPHCMCPPNCSRPVRCVLLL